MGAGKKDQVRNGTQKDFVPLTEVPKKLSLNNLGSSSKRSFEDKLLDKAKGFSYGDKAFESLRH